VVNPLVPAKTVPELIAYAKANPGKINMASVGIGSGADIPSHEAMSENCHNRTPAVQQKLL